LSPDRTTEAGDIVRFVHLGILSIVVDIWPLSESGPHRLHPDDMNRSSILLIMLMAR
jgi:hypothetical protein